MSLLTTANRKDITRYIYIYIYIFAKLFRDKFQLSRINYSVYRAINCNLSHDREAGKLHAGKTAMPDNEIHVGWIKTLDPNFKYLFYCTLFYFP